MSRPDRDRFLDQWLIPRGEALCELARLALAMVEHVEVYYGTRTRKRREEDRKTLKELVETVIANLAYAVVDEHGPRTIAVSLSKAKKLTRYDRHIFRQLPAILPILQQHDILRLTKSSGLGRRSTIEATEWFRRKVCVKEIGIKAFARHQHEETIILSRTTSGFLADGSFGKRRGLIDYEHDTEETRRYRSEMTRINEFLGEADLAFVSEDSSEVVHPNQRRLRRYFTLPPWDEDEAPRFDLGGRLFGGWWQSLPRGERHRIRINGEQIVDLDFSSMFPRLAYLKLGLEPPPGDLYAVPGLEDPRYRDGVKGMMNALLFAPGPKQRMPSEFRRLLPRGWTTARVKAAILARHPALEPLFEQGVAGFQLMFEESRIIVAVLLELIDEGIVALPMHDGVMVPASEEDRVRRVMGDAAEKVAGLRLPTTVKHVRARSPEPLKRRRGGDLSSSPGKTQGH